MTDLPAKACSGGAVQGRRRSSGAVFRPTWARSLHSLGETFANNPLRCHEVMKARVQRCDALWSITKRKRETLAKIVLGGAVLAALAQADQDEGRAASITAILDRHVLRVRDRIILRHLTGLPLPLHPGADFDETAG